jgi:hypothetical protein
MISPRKTKFAAFRGQTFPSVNFPKTKTEEVGGGSLRADILYICPRGDFSFLLSSSG